MVELQIVELLTDDTRVISNLEKCFESPRAYFEENSDCYEERWISENESEGTIK